ncbi:hypothetical protein MN608_00799 [Microdochium nivale]|nr:hypothetical protein MN608_00799 [Microdochium nivale]
MADHDKISTKASAAGAAAGKLRRPSFASPTKSSMARANPDIVKRRSAQIMQGGEEEGEYPLASDPNEPGSGNHDSGAADTQARPRKAAAPAAAGSTGQRGRSFAKPMPRPFPPRAQDEDDLVDPFRRKGLRRSPPPGVLPRIEPEEPDLPPTPVQAGLSDPAAAISSPSGIHSSPSKRAKRNRGLSERFKGSPLKQPPLQDAGIPADPSSPSTAKEPRSAPEKLQQGKSENPRRPHKARRVKESDQLATQRATRDSLLYEIASLKRDLAMLNRESERLFRSQEARTIEPATEPFDNIESLVELLCRRVLPAQEKPQADATEEWLEAAMNPVALLPFGGGAASLPLLLPASTEEDEQEEPDKAPVSHYPVAMTAEEELPYLQLFSSLAFRSSCSTVPRGRSDKPTETTIMQKHSISISSTPPGLFAAHLDITVNTKKLSVTSINVPLLEPAAASELGPFIHSIAENKNDGSGSHIRNSALARNASIITWAMGEWVRLATKRARFWCAVEQALASKDGIAKSVAAIRAGNKRKRQQRGSDDEDSEDEHGGRDRQGRFTKAQILPHMGRTSFELKVYGSSETHDDGDASFPSVRMQWTIEFDWTGEGQSKLALQVETPPHWHGQGSKDKLGKIPGVFEKLIADRTEPLEALKTVVALLVGDGWK